MGGENLRARKKLDRDLDKHAVGIIRCNLGSGAAELTRPRFRVITRTKWEVNMTRKYSVASSAIVSERVENLNPGALNFLVRKIINENARVSECWKPQYRPMRVKENSEHQRREKGLCMRSPRIYWAGKIRTGDMRRGVPEAVVELHRWGRNGGRERPK